MCHHVCTVANAVHAESASPRGWGLTMFALATGLLRHDDRAAAERLFQCAGCELCYADCMSHFRPARAIRAARADMVQEGIVPASVTRVAADVRTESNLFGQESRGRNIWRQGLEITEQGEVLLFADCDLGFRQSEIGRAVVRIARAANVALAILDDEPCCGAPLHTLGYWTEVRQIAQNNVAQIARGHYRAVVFACPTCQRMFAQTYQEELDVPWLTGVEILHTSQWLQRLLESDQLNLHLEASGSFTYHDPCALGRAGMGIYDAPRNVLRQMGAALTEVEFNQEVARCCGSSVLHETFPKIAQTAAADTLRDILRTRASTLVTACPACKGAFAAATGESDLQVMDLVQVVAASLKV